MKTFRICVLISFVKALVICEIYGFNFDTYYDNIESIIELEEALQAAQEKGNKEHIFYLSTRIADYYLLYEHDIVTSKEYLDGITPLYDLIDDDALKGIYFALYSSYYSHKMDSEQSHLYAYKALDFLEKSNDYLTRQMAILYSLSFTYIQKKDVHKMRQLISKMESIVNKENSDYNQAILYITKSYFFKSRYNKDDYSNDLDSAMYYDRQVINLYESGKINSFKTIISYNYTNLSECLISHPDYNEEEVLFYLDKAKSYTNLLDTGMVINQLWIRGLVYEKERQVKEAYQLFSEQLELMDQWSVANDLNMYTGLYGKLSETSYLLKDYEGALRYAQLKDSYKDRIYDKEKYEIIEELQTKYEVNKKDMEIVLLNEQTHLQSQINLLLWSLLFIFVVSLVLLSLWFRNKHKIKNQQILIYEMKNAEAEYEKEIREEHLKKMELEKYEALLGSYFKDQTIVGKDNELKQLKDIQSNLNMQIQEYSDRLQSYENSHKKQKTPLINELEEIIVRGLRSNEREKNKYLKKLDMIGSSFEEKLRPFMTDLNIQYCMCFAIGMTSVQIGRCFNIESRSLATTKTRIKEKLGLAIDTKLDIYLNDLLFDNTHL